jgi:hypothetical protein
MGQPKPCPWRMSSKEPLNIGCTINETGYCNKKDCPFVDGYLKRLQDGRYKYAHKPSN